MRTLFIVSEKKIEAHRGEEYDYILEVTDEPTTENIKEMANRVRGRIRSLWMDQGGYDDRRVECHLDAASPFNTMLIDLQLILKEEEGIAIELPYLETTEPKPLDREAQAAIERLDSRNELLP